MIDPLRLIEAVQRIPMRGFIGVVMEPVGIVRAAKLAGLGVGTVQKRKAEMRAAT